MKRYVALSFALLMGLSLHVSALCLSVSESYSGILDVVGRWALSENRERHGESFVGAAPFCHRIRTLTYGGTIVRRGDKVGKIVHCLVCIFPSSMFRHQH